MPVGFDKNTSIHLADVRANYPGKHSCTEYSAIMENGKRIWKNTIPYLWMEKILMKSEMRMKKNARLVKA